MTSPLSSCTFRLQSLMFTDDAGNDHWVTIFEADYPTAATHKRWLERGDEPLILRVMAIPIVRRVQTAIEDAR